MIVETIGRVLYGLVPSLSVALTLVIPASVLAALLFLLWPLVNTFQKRIRQVDNLPGPKCQSVILGNVPPELLKSFITSADHKSLIVSKCNARATPQSAHLLICLHQA